jgi:hypothetical protein
MSLNNTILSVTRRTTKGFTVGEIFDRVTTQSLKKGDDSPVYSSVRARVAELCASGKLTVNSTRKDPVSGRDSFTYVRSNS